MTELSEWAFGGKSSEQRNVPQYCQSSAPMPRKLIRSEGAEECGRCRKAAFLSWLPYKGFEGLPSSDAILLSLRCSGFCNEGISLERIANMLGAKYMRIAGFPMPTYWLQTEEPHRRLQKPERSSHRHDTEWPRISLILQAWASQMKASNQSR